jgi:hypothetical protein
MYFLPKAIMNDIKQSAVDRDNYKSPIKTSGPTRDPLTPSKRQNLSPCTVNVSKKVRFDCFNFKVKVSELKEESVSQFHIEKALEDPGHFAVIPLANVNVSQEEVENFIEKDTLWCPIKKNNDFIAGQTEIIETLFIKKIMDSVRNNLPDGYGIFNFFSRLYSNDSYLKPPIKIHLILTIVLLSDYQPTL